jgi:GTP pyrophosphokinase
VKTRQIEPELDALLAQGCPPMLAAAQELIAPALARNELAAGRLAATLKVLREIGVDPATEAAALLRPLVQAGGLEIATVAHRVGEAAAALLLGHAESEKVWQCWRHRPAGSNAEGLRRLLLLLIRDVRVVFILLAEQVVELRSLTKAPAEVQQAAARLTADIHAPLANRLGLSQIKWELEDFSFRYLNPEQYKTIAKQLDEKREERESYIVRLIDTIRQALAAAGIQAEVRGRPKHIFSIWKKMQRKRIGFEQLYDVRAVRLMVADIPTCYAALSVIHGLWPHIPTEFDDYIAQPKGNNYRSLHTAVYGPEGKPVEVQIRTPEMHAQAELGVAAHWRYKEGGEGDAEFEQRIAALRQALETREDGAEDSALLQGYDTQALDPRIYVLTPKNEVIDLPRGATVLDYAYAIHSRIGHSCRGAKINGRIVPLTQQPATGDVVEILTQKGLPPRREWIYPNSPYLTTARARSKVKAYFNKLDQERNLAQGREIYERELRKAGLTAVTIEALTQKLSLQSPDELLIKLAMDDLSPVTLVHAAQDLLRPPALPPAGSETETVATRKATGDLRDAIVLGGVGNLLVNMAACCRPLPGDAVVGFITRGRGISVHRADCPALKHLATREPDRITEVSWGAASGRYPVRILIRAADRTGLVRDIGSLFAADKVNVLGFRSQVRAQTRIAEIEATIEVAHQEQLQQVLLKLKGVPNVIEVRRA